MSINRVSSNQQIRSTTPKGAKNKASVESSNFTPNAQKIAKRLTQPKVSNDSPPISPTISQPAAQAASTKSAAKVSEPGETKFYQPVYLAKSVCGGYICETDLKACKELFQTGV